MDSTLGQILQFGFAFQMHNWALCHGQALQVRQYTALYSLLGTYFGGDGVNTFNIPDLRVKKKDGSYYRHGELMENGLPYLESQISLFGIYPSRD
jgi:microcystin-dependent protein